MKVHIIPTFKGVDEGDGGIRRVVEAQRRWLPHFGIEIVDDIQQADFVATHAGVTGNIPQAMPWIVHTHGLYWQEYEWPRWSLQANDQVIDAIRRADHVTAPSEWVAQTLRRAMWLRPSVLHHGVDMQDWEPVDRPGDYVLWNKNRPDPVCDPRPVITLAEQAPDLNFVSTFGQDRANVRITHRIPYKTMKELVRHAGAYLCTTRETFGIGTIEAMAAGVPVVGWNWGGQREIIEHGVTGWLSPPGDFDGLEEGIRWALANRTEVGEAAREAVRKRWTWEHVMSQYVSIYKSVYEAKAERYSGPRVSVVVPCYNHAQYLPQAIRSLQRQTMEDWEAIIVNDASPDNTAEVAASLADADSRVRVITNPKNLYLAGALNAGIASTRGRYIVPLDADNQIEPWTLELLSSALDSDRSIHIAYGAARFVLEDGETPDQAVAPDGVSGLPNDFSFRGQMLHRNQIPSTCMYRREAWERSGGYRRRCRTGEDAENWTRLASLGFVPSKVTSRPTLIYRQVPNSMSRREAEWDWTAWFPWSRRMALVPFGVHEKPPSNINAGISWPVSSYEPVHVAVVIPVGPGHQELLIDALDSVEAQTYRRWECIVVNDTGHDLNIPHSWAKVIEGDRNERMGPARARNLAIEASIAPVFVPLDADDYLQPEALERMLAVYEEHGGVVYSQWHDDKGDVIEVYDPPDYDAQLLVSKGAIHAVTAMYPKAAWREVGGFDEEMSHWEDWDFQLKMASIGVCGSKIPLPLFTYRKTTGQRREANMAAFDQGRNAILRKWSQVWDGRETLMACSGCPGGGGQRYPSPPRMAQANGGGGRLAEMQPREGYVVMKYNGLSTSTRVYRGPKTATNYRFGNNPVHRMSYVYQEDVAHFLSISDGGQPMFELVQSAHQPAPDSATLVAAGPPVQPRAEMVDRVSTINSGPEVVEQILAGTPTAVADRPIDHTDPPAALNAIRPPEGARDDGLPDEEIPLPLYSLSEMRKGIGSWPMEKVAMYLAHEKAQPEPRKGAITLLERRLRDGGSSEWTSGSST